MTLKRIAELAGTSVATVSKAFSGSREISAQTKERIFRVAKEQGCFDKYYKAKRERPLIALLFPEPESEYYAKNIGILERALAARDADVIVAFTRFDPAREAALFRELAYGLRVDGILLWGSGKLIQNPEHLPLITVTESSGTAENADMVKNRFDDALHRLAQTLKEYGHRRVGFIGETLTLSKERRFREALRSVGLPVHNRYIALSDQRFEQAGEDGMRMLIEGGELPSVIVAAYDRIAYGAMRYAKERGIAIPDELSFVGMDDIATASYLDVPLTSFHLELEKGCAEIVELLFKRIQNRYYRSREEITLPVTLHFRASLKNIARGAEE